MPSLKRQELEQQGFAWRRGRNLGMATDALPSFTPVRAYEFAPKKRQKHRSHHTMATCLRTWSTVLVECPPTRSVLVPLPSRRKRRPRHLVSCTTGPALHCCLMHVAHTALDMSMGGSSYSNKHSVVASLLLVLRPGAPSSALHMSSQLFDQMQSLRKLQLSTELLWMETSADVASSHNAP